MTETTTNAGALPVMQAPKVHNGTYTVSHPEKGHFTVKLWTVQRGRYAGERMLGILDGPDNESHFDKVAFYREDEDRPRAIVFRNRRGPDSRGCVTAYNWQTAGWSQAERKLAIFLGLAVRGEGIAHAEGCTLQAATVCCVCNRKLTTPESIAAGYGPVCAGRIS